MNNQERNIESLHIHIDGLQSTLTKRNAKIAQLEKRLVLLEKLGTYNSYHEGFDACALQIVDLTAEMGILLKRIGKDAWNLSTNVVKK
jgi:hypothetical protein